MIGALSKKEKGARILAHRYCAGPGEGKLCTRRVRFSRIGCEANE